MLGVGIGLTGPLLQGSPFVPLATTPTAWYDPSDITTLWQDSARTVPVTAHGDPVGAMDDKSGNAKHAIQATAGNRPLYQVEGSDKFLLFDGVDDALSVTMALAMPFDRISAIRQATSTSGDRIFAGAVSTEPLLRQGASPIIAIAAGGTAMANSGLAVGSNGVVTERFIAGASKLAVNNGAYVTGDVGSTALTALILGASTAAGGSASNVRFYGAAMKAGGFTDAQIAQWRAHLGAKCGVGL